MNELTIEQLKALPKYEWVWIKYKHEDSRGEVGFYVMKQIPTIMENPDNEFWTVGDGCYYYSDYGTKWLAYKNKEQAEGNWVELPCEARFSFNSFVTVYASEDGEICISNAHRR